MIISKEKLYLEAETTGFRPEVLEKVIQLMNLLENFRSHPFLKDRLALKGGTALNLFVFNVPRLSVDIDLNYIGAVSRDEMLAERPKVEQAVRAVCEREGFTIRQMPAEHAGGRWSLRYQSASGQGGNLEVDVNFMFRSPLWPVLVKDSRSVGSYKAAAIPILDIHELAAGKLAALFARNGSRDLFDVHQLLTSGLLDRERLRLAFVVYGAMNRRDWRTVSDRDMGFEANEFQNSLLPLLRRDFLPGVDKNTDWATRLVEECRQALEAVLPLSKAEVEFLDRLLDEGEITPSLLTEDSSLADRIGHHPALEWKILNVRRYKRE